MAFSNLREETGGRPNGFEFVATNKCLMRVTYQRSDKIQTYPACLKCDVRPYELQKLVLR
jgi:hypothetical protein